MIRFLHAADLHLDSPLKGLSRYEGAPVETLQRSLRGALENLVATAIEERVSLVLLAGDIYDGDCRDYNTLLFFCQQMQKLAAAGIRVVVISGNHDAANAMTCKLRLDQITRLPNDRAATVEFPEIGVAVHGQGFANRDVRDNLACAYPAAVRGLFNIGLLHTCATGGDGAHEAYAPCSLNDLRAKGYDYWALGHIHKRAMLSRADEPPITFSGNIQGRDIGETGPKGCLIVEVDDAHRVTARFRPLDVIRWQHVEVDVCRAKSFDDALSAVRVQLNECWRAAEHLPTAARVTLTGPSRAHEQLAVRWPHFTNEVRAQGIQAADGGLWIEKVVCNTKPYSAPEAATMDGPLGELMTLVEELQADEAALAAFVREIPELVHANLADYVEVANPAWLRQRLFEAQSLLVGRLTAVEAAR